MKFTCTQDNLVRALTQVAPIAGRNNQLPILQYILLQAKDNTLSLTATDLEVGIHTVIGGKMENEGSLAIPARRVLEYVQQLPTTHPITIESKGQVLAITTKGFKAQFPTSDPEEFPLLPQVTSSTVISLQGHVLTTALNRVAFAATREEMRPEIHSVYVKLEGRQVWLAATDSFRLTEEILPLSDEQKEAVSFLLPLNTAQEVIRLFSDQEKIHLIPQDNYVTFKGESLELSSRLIDGKYPDYQQIIPTTHSTEVTIDRSQLIRALKTLTVFLPKDSRRVRLQGSPDTHTLFLKVEGSEAGSGEVTLDCQVTGEEVDILLNIQYILEGVQKITESECRIEFGGAHNPVVFHPPGRSGYTYIVMPIQA